MTSALIALESDWDSGERKKDRLQVFCIHTRVPL
jgi:hypothetical protein